MNDVLDNQLVIELTLVNPYIAEYTCMYNYMRYKSNGPAMIYHHGDKQYYCNNELHNHNGPAVLSIIGYRGWWVNNNLIKMVKYE